MKAAIFDYKPVRRGLLEKVLRNADWSCDPHDQVWDKDGIRVQVLHCNLVLLHQRGPDNSVESGNEDSWEFFTGHLLPKVSAHEVFLISYTGGSATDWQSREPEEFRAFREADGKGWCVYLNSVNEPSDIKLREFAEAWQNPNASPPIHLLQSPKFPEASIAAYICERVGKLDAFPDVKTHADIECQGDYAGAVSQYFGEYDSRVLRLAEYGILALSLRSKTSHSWLDNEILSTQTETVVQRWRDKAWGEAFRRWHTLHELAEEFGAALPELSVSSLVDQLEIFKGSSPEKRAELKRRLDDLPYPGMTMRERRSEYMSRLQEFWSLAQRFEELADSSDVNEQVIRETWTVVRERADALKQLFRNGTIPDGIIVP